MKVTHPEEMGNFKDGELASIVIREWQEDQIIDRAKFHTDAEYHAFVYRLAYSSIKGLRRVIK